VPTRLRMELRGGEPRVVAGGSLGAFSMRAVT